MYIRVINRNEMQHLAKKVIIYIIDDDELFSGIIKNKFNAVTPYRVITFSSTEHFIEHLKFSDIPSHILEIAILDYYFMTNGKPSMNGVEAMKEIMKLKPRMKVIFVSGRYDQSVANEAKMLGAIDFIKKNEAIFTRILNRVRYILSEYSLYILSRRRKQMTLIFIGLVLLGGVIFSILHLTKMTF